MKTVTLNDGTTINLDITHEWKNLKVIEMEIPGGIDGCIARWGEDSGEYRIFINNKMDDRQKIHTFIHEILHLYRGDFDKEGGNVNQIEAECHQLTQEILEALNL